MKSANYKHQLTWIKNTKDYLVGLFGGKCESCGYVPTSNRVFDFHHVNPSEKLFSISSWKSKNLNHILKELEKCLLLCANCHREIEAGCRKCPRLKKRILVNNKKVNKTITEVRRCKCGDQFQVICNSKQVYCRKNCPSRYKIQWPSNEELLLLLKNSNYLSLSKKLGVSDNAIRKRLSRFN